MRRNRSDDGHDNPAWPALVDVFAFTLVLVLILWSLAPSKQDLQQARKDLNDCKKALENCCSGCPSTAGVVIEVEKNAGEMLSRIAGELDAPYPSDRGDTAPDLTVESFGRQISFGGGQFDLTEEDEALLRAYMRRLAAAVKDWPVLVLIEGRADPRNFTHPSAPPRDNIELSALRAAFVAKLVKDEAAELLPRLWVVGLGEEGTIPTGPEPIDIENLTARYRRVSFKIQPDRATILRNVASRKQAPFNADPMVPNVQEGAAR